MSEMPLKYKNYPKLKHNTKWRKIHYKITIFGAFAPYPRIIYWIASSISQGKKDDIIKIRALVFINQMILIFSQNNLNDQLLFLAIWILLFVKTFSYRFWKYLHRLVVWCIFGFIGNYFQPPYFCFVYENSEN